MTSKFMKKTNKLDFYLFTDDISLLLAGEKIK